MAASKQITKKDFDNYPFDNFLSEDDKGRRLIVNPLTKNKVLLYNKKGIEVSEALNKFFPHVKIETDHLDNNIIENIIEKSSLTTKAALNLVNKNANALLKPHKSEARGKANYEYFVEMMKRVANMEYSGIYYYVIILIGETQSIFITFTKLSDGPPFYPVRFTMESRMNQSNPPSFWLKNMDTFDIFEIKNKKILADFVKVFKTLQSVEVPWNIQLQKGWSAHIKNNLF